MSVIKRMARPVHPNAELTVTDGRESHEPFDQRYYLDNNPDVAEAGVDPYEHFLAEGKAEGRLGVPPEPREPFDASYYLEHNPDVAAAGIDPYEHFIAHGKAEGRVGTRPRVTELFDAEFYLENYPDIAAAGVDPYEHFVTQGKAEGRIGAPPELDCLDALGELDATRETVLVVSHEASRTGAPILSLNIARQFRRKYNVISLLLGEGDIVGDFKQASDVVVGPVANGRVAATAASVVAQLVANQKIAFAIVNSIESRSVLEALAKHFIPAITLIHEFAAYTRPRGAFLDVIVWSSDTVFSAPVILQDAISEYPDIANAVTHILPQGRCELPTTERGDGGKAADAARLVKAMRPRHKERCTVVLGAGSVQLRKGVDLFIECAAQVLKAGQGESFHFVWVGKGFDPERDLGYSVYLADQVKRAGLSEHVSFLGETSNIDVAYAEADVLLISSRLDPLPNVAIDAMANGVPVICFDRTTGIADVLKGNGLGVECVAPYLDAPAMAERVLAFMRSEALRQRTGARCREIVQEQFAMPHYVDELEALAKAAVHRQSMERVDTSAIIDSSLPQLDFVRPPHRRAISRERAIRNYVRAWASEICERKPFPGFHPGIYREHLGMHAGSEDPFAHYIGAGQPRGPWNYEVIRPEFEPAPLPVGARIALHLHVYYADLLPEILRLLNTNKVRPDLLISVPSDQAQQDVRRIVDSYDGRVVEIRVVPNCGRDIGPFLTAFGSVLLRDYDVVGHLHTKKTVDLADSQTGETWRQFLLANLLGDETRMADRILGQMFADSTIGMVFPDDPYAVGWGANRQHAQDFMPQLGLDRLPDHFLFPIGTMFWARTEALRPFFELGLDWGDYPAEPLPYDGSMLHALERLFGVCTGTGPFRVVATYVPGVAR